MKNKGVNVSIHQNETGLKDKGKGMELSTGITNFLYHFNADTLSIK